MCERERLDGGWGGRLMENERKPNPEGKIEGHREKRKKMREERNERGWRDTERERWGKKSDE